MRDLQNDNQVHISVVAPAYDEEENIQQLVTEITAQLQEMAKSYEIVIVNDCSADKTAGILKAISANQSCLKVYTMKNRSGQSAALEAALKNSGGRFIATMDADLQNDPKDIPKMLDLVESGACDFVNGWRKNRNDPFTKRISTRIANAIRNMLTNEQIKDSACGLKVFRRECIENIKFFNGAHRWLPTLVKMEGYTVQEIPVNHRPRVRGKTKYGVSNRLFRGVRDIFAIRWMRSRHLKYEYEEMRS